MDNREHSYSQAFKQIARTANSSLPLKNVLNSAAKSAAKALKAAGCSIMLLNPQKEHLDIIAAYGLSDLYLRKGALKASKSLPEVLNGELVTIFDVTQDERAQYPEAAEMEGISSVLAAPIPQRGEVVGEIRIYTREPRKFSQADKDFLTTVANIIAVSLEKNELYQVLKAEHEETVTKRRKLTETPELPSSSLRPSSFGHPSEEEFAKLLDFYRIEWLYEPRSFPLAWQDGKVVEMFTPDFYLPELDLYIELTTLKQSLITEKNRKLRRLRELYPEINIKLLNKSDYLRLLAKYGYGRLGGTKVKGIDQVLFSHTQIQRRVKALAKRISHDYMGRKLVLVGILKGVMCFMADLMQHITLPLNVDFMAISYYGTDNESAVKITKDLDTSIAGLDVLMVEDIVDTGMTLNYVLNHLTSHNPASLRVCTLLDKRVRRLIDVPLDYIGFEIPDEFVVGYGLDYHGEYRNLPFIGVLKPELIEEDGKK
ncbi:MAG: hypoxanthine phosphoribosyltransferase [Chloroflexi bacterium]|nr:hypoxanthine phosphoribosyltransferase [Chloroflexota bacterium]